MARWLRFSLIEGRDAYVDIDAVECVREIAGGTSLCTPSACYDVTASLSGVMDRVYFAQRKTVESDDE